MQTGTFDVVVLGGGLSGLTLALQLKKERPGMAIAVLERRSFPVPEACFKVGESSVEIGAYYFSKVIGLEDHIREAQLPKFGLRYFFSHGDNKDITQRLEMGGNSFFPTPSYQLDRGRLENHLADRVRNQGITLFENSKVNSITLLEDLHQVCIEGQEKPLVCRWVVDASGRAGLLKHQNQLSESVSHQASSAWFRLNTKVNIDHWSEDQDWRHGHEGQYSRWFSTNHFMGQGYWVWIIPLSSGQTSIGIVADSGLHPLSTFNSKEKALDWLMQHEPQVGSEISSLSHLMTDFLAVKNFSHGAKEVFSPKRWCLTGEAGVFLDPFYSPGSDFIAVSNTFVTDLIVRFFDGEDIGQRARIYSQLYLSYFQNTLPVYEGQYKLFGNPDLMPLKVIWDYATYWTQLAFIFMQGYLCDLTVFNLIRSHLAEIGSLNFEMQAILRNAANRSPAPSKQKFIDVTSIPYMLELNRTLSTTLSPEEFSVSFKLRVERLKQLQQMIVNFLATEDNLDSFIASLQKFPAGNAQESMVAVA